MWHSEDFMIADEVVADGAQCHRRVSFPHQTTFEESTKFCENNYSGKLNSDSGFLSGVNINEDSAVITSSSINLSDEQDSMKLKSAAQFSVNEINLDYKSGKINNLSSPVKPQKELPRRITLRDLLRQDEDGDTPLHLAVLQGFIEVVFSLVRILPDPRLLEIPNKYLQTPLHLAVLTNQAPLVRRLVVGGASVLLRDRLGNTPLHLACRDGHVDCAHALLLPVSHEERQSALLPLHIVPQPLPQDLEQKNYDGCINTFTLHVFVFPHFGWFGSTATTGEKADLCDVFVAQRVVTFHLDHNETQHKNAILNAYNDVFLEDFVAQRAVSNGSRLTSLRNLSTEELQKESGLLWCTSIKPLELESGGQRCAHCFQTISNSVDSYQLHQLGCQRRNESLEIFDEESDEFHETVITQVTMAHKVPEHAATRTASQEERRLHCLLAVERRLPPLPCTPPLTKMFTEIVSVGHVPTDPPTPSAIAKLEEHRKAVMQKGVNSVRVRRGEYLIHDFLALMKTEDFRRNKNKFIGVTFQNRNENGSLSQELGIGVGPLKDLLSTLLEKLVYTRLSVLSHDGTSDSEHFLFSQEDWNSEMFAAGQISGLAIVQTSLCPWWMLPVYNRLVAIQKPGAEQHPYIAGLVSQHAADKILSDLECVSLFNCRPLTPEHVMGILDWSEMSKTKNTAIKRAERESRQWFAEWLTSPDVLSKVVMFLTGSAIIPSTLDYLILVKFVQLQENEKRRPVVRTCPEFAELLFPVYVTKEELTEVWIDAIQQLDAGFTFV